jgi:hypothetical protein
MPMRAKQWDVSEGLWERIESLLLKKPRRFRYSGRKPFDDRLAFPPLSAMRTFGSSSMRGMLRRRGGSFDVCFGLRGFGLVRSKRRAPVLTEVPGEPRLRGRSGAFRLPEVVERPLGGDEPDEVPDDRQEQPQPPEGRVWRLAAVLLVQRLDLAPDEDAEDPMGTIILASFRPCSSKTTPETLPNRVLTLVL